MYIHALKGFWVFCFLFCFGGGLVLKDCDPVSDLLILTNFLLKVDTRDTSCFRRDFPHVSPGVQFYGASPYLRGIKSFLIMRAKLAINVAKQHGLFLFIMKQY